MATDVFSKYGWIRPSRDKKGETVSEAFKTIFKEGREPQNLWVDKGKEFYIKHLKELLEKNNSILNRKWRKIQCCWKMELNNKTENVETVYNSRWYIVCKHAT